jgi:hypothetical protein
MNSMLIQVTERGDALWLNQTGMDEASARAFYKGYIRTIKDSVYDPDAIPVFKKGRNAWLHQSIKDYARDPTFVLLINPLIEHAGKESKAWMIGVDFNETKNGEQRIINWLGTYMELRARKFSIEKYRLPILITSHLVERTMQRLNQESPVKALRYLNQAFFAALALQKPVPGQVYLQTSGGVVVAKPHEADPNIWALITFIDQDKLAPEQVREAKYWEEIRDETIIKKIKNKTTKPL